MMATRRVLLLSVSMGLLAAGAEPMGRLDDALLVAWGSNSNGQSNVPAGYYRNLALRSDGSLAAWGWNTDGQSDVPTDGYLIDIAAGQQHNLALKARQSYDDLLVAGSGRSALVQRSIDVAGDAVVESMMDVQNNAAMTVAGLTPVVGGSPDPPTARTCGPSDGAVGRPPHNMAWTGLPSCMSTTALRRENTSCSATRKRTSAVAVEMNA